MATPRFRTVFSLMAALVLVAVFLFGGAGMTAYASQSALPGDALYGVKTGVEQTRVSLARDAADKANLNLAFAERRLDEIARLIANGRYKDIAQAVQEYERYVQSAIAALETVAAGDPAGAQALASQVAVLLKRYTETLSGMVGALPDTARGEVERAIQVSHDASSFSDEIEFTGMVEAINPDLWVVAGQTLTLIAASEIKGTIVVGDLVKVHALQDANGALVLREVKLATGDDLNENSNGNANGNANDNGNMNDNANGNANDNGDDDHEFTGIVEQISADFWVIGGQTLAITAGSEIHGNIQVGDFVKVETTLDASGNLVLSEVKLASGDDANANDDDDMNGNDNDDDDMNENDDNANGNINENDNGDDDHEGNVNQNGNLNDNGDDDHNGNANDNGNANGNDNDDDSNDNDNDSNDNDDDSNDNDSNDNDDDSNDNSNENDNDD